MPPDTNLPQNDTSTTPTPTARELSASPSTTGLPFPHLPHLVTAGGVGLWEWDVAHRAVWLNPVACQLLGLPAVPSVITEDEWLRHTTGVGTAAQDPVASGILADLMSGARAQVSVTLQPGPSTSLHCVTLAGQVVRTGPSVRPLRLAGSVSPGIGAHMLSATWRETADLLLAHSLDLVHVLSPNMDVLWVSPSVKQILGFTPEERIGLNGGEMIHPEDAERHAREVEQAMRGQMATRFEVRLQHKDDGWRWVDIVGCRIQRGPLAGALVSWARPAEEQRRQQQLLKARQAELEHMVSERTSDLRRTVANLKAEVERRRLVEDQLRAREGQIARAARFAAASQMVAGLVHEVRSPLGTWGMGLDLIEQAVHDLAIPDAAVLGQPRTVGMRQVQTQINALRLAWEHVTEVIDVLSDYGGQRATHTQATLAPASLVTTAARMMTQTAQAHRARIVVHDPPADLPPILGSPTRLRQALVNLLGNACEAMGTTGGTVTITLAHVEAGLEIAIEDDGIGLPVDLRELIGEPFVTTKGDRGGLGLGLAIVQRIVRDHGGTFTLGPRRSTGTRATILLPTLPRGTLE